VISRRIRSWLTVVIHVIDVQGLKSSVEIVSDRSLCLPQG